MGPRLPGTHTLHLGLREGRLGAELSPALETQPDSDSAWGWSMGGDKGSPRAAAVPSAVQFVTMPWFQERTGVVSGRGLPAEGRVGAAGCWTPSLVCLHPVQVSSITPDPRF